MACTAYSEHGGREQLAELGLDALLAALLRKPRGIRTCHEHEVVAGGQLARGGPERFPQKALHPVALDRAAHLAPDRDTEPRLVLRRGAREGVDDEVAVRVRPALAIDAVELG